MKTSIIVINHPDDFVLKNVPRNVDREYTLNLTVSSAIQTGIHHTLIFERIREQDQIAMLEKRIEELEKRVIE